MGGRIVFHAFIVDDDKYAAEATYKMFPWKELNVSRVVQIYTPTGLTERILTEKGAEKLSFTEISDIKEKIKVVFGGRNNEYKWSRFWYLFQ